METGLTKSVNSPQTTSGVFVGLVKRVDLTTKKVWVQIGRLTGQKTIGPLAVVGPLPNIGYRVACQFMENGELIVLGAIQQTAATGPIDGGMIVQDSPPEPERQGQQWFDTSTGSTYIALDVGTGLLVWVETGGTGAMGPTGPAGPPTPPISDFIATAETTSSTTPIDLATIGPVVSMTTGTVVRATVSLSGRRTAGSFSQYASVAVSGATTIAAPAGMVPTGTIGLTTTLELSSTTLVYRAMELVISGLTPGVNVFTVKYSVLSTTTGEFSNRLLAVERLD